MSEAVEERNAGRVLLLDPEDRLLMLACADPHRDEPMWWITPGGGCEPGESFAEAALREAWEETGFDDLQIEADVWTRTATFPWLSRTICQHEHFFVCRIHERQREPKAQMHTPDEAMYLHGHRWWSVEEIEAETANGVRFAPRGLGVALRALLADGPPERPVDVGI